jgi:hypothetical protein
LSLLSLPLLPVWGPVPGPNEAFTGRDGMLVRLREGLQGSGRSVVHALHGAGGVGKTQLAAEYAWRFAGDYDAVWWVNAEQADRIGEQYTEFAVAWGLVDPATPVGPAVDALRRFCRSRSRWLVVLDNATSAGDIAPWRLPGPGHMLITSRDRDWREIAKTAVPVDVFARSESIALLRAHLPTLPDPDADRLADALGGLPLALAQAAGLLAETGMPVSDYLRLLDEAPAEVLDEGTPISYPRSLARSLRVALAQLASTDPTAAQLLTLCAYLAPDPIPTGWFPATDPTVLPEPLASTVRAPLAYRRALGTLGRYALVKLGEDHLTVHRLTQRLLRADDPTPGQTAATVARVLARLALGDPDDLRTWPAWADLLPHLRALDLATTDDEKLARQACEAASYLRRRGEPHAWHDLIAPLYRAWRDRFGPTAQSSLCAASHLALVLGALGRWRDAVALNRELHDHEVAIYGDDHPNTLSAASNIAGGLAELGEYEEARTLTEDTLSRRRRVLGDDHPDTLASADNLALRLAALGEHERACALAEDTLARCRRVLGDNHPDTLGSANNLASNLRALGEHERARTLAEDTLARCRRVLGDDHPSTLTLAQTLAISLAELGEHERALALAEDTLARCRGVLGDDHPDTLTSASILTPRLAKLGEHERALALAEDTLTRRRRVLGDDHPDTLASLDYLAVSLAELGEYELAHALAEDIFARFRRVLGDNHPNTLASAYNLAMHLAALGKHERARALAEDTLTRSRGVLGDDHPDTRQSLALLQGLGEQAAEGQK